jgi:hypothetical protein
MSKTDLRARPMFARTRDAIEAHLTIVFTALAVSREIQNWPIATPSPADSQATALSNRRDQRCHHHDPARDQPRRRDHPQRTASADPKALTRMTQLRCGRVRPRRRPAHGPGRVAAGTDRLHVVRRGSPPTHGRREVVLVDAPCFDRPDRLIWRKRTWRCPESSGARKVFTEPDPDVAAPRALLTTRACRRALNADQATRSHAEAVGGGVPGLLRHRPSQQRRRRGHQRPHIDTTTSHAASATATTTG